MTEQTQIAKQESLEEKNFEERVDNALMDKMVGDSGALDRLTKEHYDTINNLEVKGVITHNQALIFTKMIVDGAKWYSKVLIMIVHTHLLVSGSIDGTVRKMGVDMANAAALEKFMKARAEGDVRF
jgi:hypothetical protein